MWTRVEKFQLITAIMEKGEERKGEKNYKSDERWAADIKIVDSIVSLVVEGRNCCN